MPDTSPTGKGRLFSALAALADEIKAEKTAAATRTKTAAPTPSDPGGYKGPSTHPIKDTDNSAQVAAEGARSSENTADVKADIAKPAVDSTPEAKPGQDEQDKVQVNIGTQQSATGEDPSVEDAYKGTKDDPGTSHPATAEDGEKYSSLSFKEAHARFTAIANEVLADLANGFGDRLNPKKAESSDPKSRPETSAPMTPAGGSKDGEHTVPGGGQGDASAKADKDAKKAAGDQTVQDNLRKASETVQKQAETASATLDTDTETQAGYELAALLGLSEKDAFDGVRATISQTIRDAELDADLFGAYFTAFTAQQQKKAEVPPEDLAGAPGAIPPGLADLVAGGEESEPPPPEGGALPPEGGASPPMGEPSEDEALAELAAALEELGIPLDALIEAAGGGGAMDEPLAGPPSGMEVTGSADQKTKPVTKGEYITKLAESVRDFKRAGKYQLKAADNPQQRQLRDAMKTHVRELLSL